MRLLQVSLRSLLLYSLLVVMFSIPVSLLSIRKILNAEIDESLSVQTAQFLKHIKSFEYLDDLETDLEVLDQLSYDISIRASAAPVVAKHYQTVSLYDSIKKEQHPYRQLSSGVDIKGKPYILTVRLSLVDNDELAWAIGTVQVVLIVLLAGGLLLLNGVLSRKLWKPFYKTLNQLKAYELDKNESIRIEKTNIIEFDDLNKTVSHLTDRNRKVFLQQKEFIENASHELQTPLAIFQSKLDMLMQGPSLSESDAAIITALEETAQRMARLNKNLLLLSKIDNEQFTDTEAIELSAIINNLLANLRPMADMGGIAITTDIDLLRITANKTLIEVLLTNLFHNAIRHTSLKRSVFIQLHGRVLKISNSGAPVKMNPEKMFERFSKEGMSANSTGLGLAIVKKICDTCAFGLTYHYEQDAHVFSVTF